LLGVGNGFILGLRCRQTKQRRANKKQNGQGSRSTGKRQWRRDVLTRF
jgi:hypothetical protein